MAKKANKFVPKYVPHELKLEKHPEKADPLAIKGKGKGGKVANLAGSLRDVSQNYTIVPSESHHKTNINGQTVVDEKGNEVSSILLKGLNRSVAADKKQKKAKAAALEAGPDLSAAKEAAEKIKATLPLPGEERGTSSQSGKETKPASQLGPQINVITSDDPRSRLKKETVESRTGGGTQMPPPFVGSKPKDDFVQRSRTWNPGAEKPGKVVDLGNYSEGDIRANMATTAYVDYPDTFEDIRREATNPGSGRTIQDMQEDYEKYGDTFETSGADVAKALHMNPRANPTDVPDRAGFRNRVSNIVIPNVSNEDPN